MPRSAAVRSAFRRLALAGLVAGVAAPLTAGAAAGATTVPKPTVALPAGVEALAKWDPARTCSPAAKPGTEKLRALLVKTYPNSRSLGISRECSQGGNSEHKEGRAFDWGNRAWIPSEHTNVQAFTKWALATDSRGNKYANARRLGIMYMIYNDRMWAADHAEQGWRPYKHPACETVASCDIVLRHREHLHISLTWAGAMGQTSFWTGRVGTAEPRSGAAPVPHTGATAARQTTSALAAYRNTVLRPGSRGKAVVALQRALRVSPTGYFGKVTLGKVRAYQRARGLPVTGVVAARTWASLQRNA